MNDSGQIVYRRYERHYSRIAEAMLRMLSGIREEFPDVSGFETAMSGSAGMGMAEALDLPFVQEVYATRVAVTRKMPETDVVIELGGEDAKILFLRSQAGHEGLEVRMNGSCAGGTGAFIDQMAALFDVTPADLDELASHYEKTYTIASRCGVFAKSDIQPLLNQGAHKEDIAYSIFTAVANQTISGLAQGRPIKGNILYLGGPLTYLKNLRKAFNEALGYVGNSLYYVALGTAMLSTGRPISPENLEKRILSAETTGSYKSCPPLFTDQEEYERFIARHAQASVKEDPDAPADRLFIGIDAGSTTVKMVVINEEKTLLLSHYQSNNGNPVPIVRRFLTEVYEKWPDSVIGGCAVTGYGEDIIKNAFSVDFGLVETIAHYTSAHYFEPDVDFIIDIGGQDIKCFQIRGGVIDNIFLNEACSSGCGSFLQSFAATLGYPIADFAEIGLFADRPVDLGSRCTVFMNSSVKQAQKDGATVDNISAGLSISVVKNALYKVIRIASADDLGRHIVVQGGTFLNNSVLRSFEQEIGRDVIRPAISGLMGAYGAALYAMENAGGTSSLLSREELEAFEHTVRSTTCKGCENHCHLTINTFSGGRRYIAGNRCERPITKKQSNSEYNLYEYKRQLLSEYQPVKGHHGKIGIPLGLNMLELLPFWHTLLTDLSFEVITPPFSNRDLYLLGQNSIPSDTVCFPAKLMHGHVEWLIQNGVNTIFYPCLTYNVDEGLGDNHFNCPVVAYYPEVLKSNMESLQKVRYVYDYLGIHRPKDFASRVTKVLRHLCPELSRGQIHAAVQHAYEEYDTFRAKIAAKGDEFLKAAEAKGLPVIVLAGRPYHIDPEINHGIDKLIANFNAVILTEDSLRNRVEESPTYVLDQWTYHSRLYAAAHYVGSKGGPRMNLIQLVSFGCGVDAVTTDEVRRILESYGKIYTQIKIDEITNLGAVKIRVRSLFSALEQQQRSSYVKQS